MALASIVVAIFLALLCVDGSKQIRTAVFLEENETPDANSYSSYLAHLTDRGHAVSYFGQASTDFALAKYGELAFDHVVILDPTLTTLGATKLEKNDLLSFVKQGGNVIVAGSIRVSKMLRQFAAECGIDFDKKGSLVMDHVNHLHDSTDVYHSLIKTTQWINSPVVVGTLQKPIVYDGIGMTVEPTNVLTFTVLSAESSAYSAVPTKPIEGSKDAIFGANVGLVTAVQARNNARVLVAGSLDLFKNTYTTSTNYDNGRFVKTITDWALGERGVLRVSNVNHSRKDGSLPDKMLNDSPRPDEPITLYPDAEIARNSLVYRIKDNLTYSFDVHEFRDGHWTPFAADDLQLEFVMLDPYVRKTMAHDSHGHFTTTFTAPDTYGIFQFRVVYRRVGYSVLHWTTQVSLRPYKHDEYERFIPAAFPYYASAFSMMAGVLIFSVVFLYGGDDVY